MRKLIKSGKSPQADVIAITRGKPKEARLEIGIDAGRKVVFLKLDGVAVAMGADKAEEVAADLMAFVYELRNGGALT